MTAYCRDCDLVHADTRKQPPSRWACVAHPRELSTPYPDVDPDYHPSPPYHLCRFIRDGVLMPGDDCPDFTPKRTGTTPS